MYREISKDLFEYAEEHKDAYLCHSVSSDMVLGRGIATQFNEKYNMRELLRATDQIGIYPNCILIYNVFNLVTKEKYYNKPTMYTITKALLMMKQQAMKQGVKLIAMPKIGCGLDRLRWDDVSHTIRELFQDTDIDIVVCVRQIR